MPSYRALQLNIFSCSVKSVNHFCFHGCLKTRISLLYKSTRATSSFWASLSKYFSSPHIFDIPRHFYPLWKLGKPGTEIMISSWLYSGTKKNQDFCYLEEHANYCSLFLPFSCTSATKMAQICSFCWKEKPWNKETESLSLSLYGIELSHSCQREVSWVWILYCWCHCVGSHHTQVS